MAASKNAIDAQKPLLWLRGRAQRKMYENKKENKKKIAHN